MELADEDGLLAIGGDLSEERLLLAYKNGIFPWYSQNGPILWWFTDPRFVLFPEKIHIGKNLQALLRRNKFHFTVNLAFREIITRCRNAKRKDEGTWIGNEIVEAYCNLHLRGFAHSAEVWLDGKLAGGLYGVKLGRIFFGESMFSEVKGASKVAFVNYVNRLKEEGVILIDCQVYTQYLESFGAEFISGRLFSEILARYSGETK